MATMTTTIDYGILVDDSSEEDDDDDEEEDGANTKVLIPVLLTVTLVAMICIATVYTKARRRWYRQSGTSDPARSVSGGVAMNVNVYRNYGVYVNALQRNQSQPGNIGEQPLCTIPYSADGPPAYDDIIKDAPLTTSNVISPSSAASAQPPPYSATSDGDPTHVHNDIPQTENSSAQNLPAPSTNLANSPESQSMPHSTESDVNESPYSQSPFVLDQSIDPPTVDADTSAGLGQNDEDIPMHRQEDTVNEQSAIC